MPAPKKKPPRKKAPPAASTKKSTATSTAAKRRATAATRKAQEASAIGKRLTAAQTVMRDTMIVALLRAGEEPKEVAKTAQVTIRTVQRVQAAAASAPSPLEQRPMELLEELAKDYRNSIADLEAMAWAWAPVNQAASLGAKKAAAEERQRLAVLMSEVGKLPSNLELFRSEMEMQRVGEEMGAALLAVQDGTMSLEHAIEKFLSFAGQRAALAPGSE